MAEGEGAVRTSKVVGLNELGGSMASRAKLEARVATETEEEAPVEPRAQLDATASESDGDRYRRVLYRKRGPDFTLKNLMLKGYVEDEVQMQDLSIRFRSISIEDEMEISQMSFDTDLPAKTYIDTVNLKKLARCIVAVNGTTTLNKEGEINATANEQWLKKMSTSAVNFILNEYFDRSRSPDRT